MLLKQLELGVGSVDLLQSDLFASIEGIYDLIVANLPYVSEKDMEKLSREVSHDPELALVGGKEGTELMQRFLSECHGYLKPGGTVAMEFGYQQSESLEHAAKQAGFEKVAVSSDHSGHERFLFAVTPCSE